MLTGQQLLAFYAYVCREVFLTCTQQNDSRRVAREVRPTISPKWDGKPDRVQPAGGRKKVKKHINIWRRIGRYMLEYHLDPTTCITERFSWNRGRPGKVQPNQIALHKYLELYESACRLAAENLFHSRKAQEETCRQELTDAEDAFGNRAEALDYVLLDEALFLTPLFRYCLALSEGRMDVAEVYEPGAMMQYLSAPAGYDEHWAEWLPDKFGENCKDIRDIALALRGKNA